MGSVAKAQIKVTAIAIHYTLLGVVGLATVTYFDTNYFEAVVEYIVCQSTGKESCEKELPDLDEILFLAAVLIMLSLLPIVAILFTCDPRACQRKKQDKASSSKSSTRQSKK